MKLYEFSYTDHLGQSEGQVLTRVAEFLESEEILQGWAEGYTFRQCRSPEQLPTGERRYIFEVIGSYLSDAGDESTEPTSTDAKLPIPGGAALPSQDHSY